MHPLALLSLLLGLVHLAAAGPVGHRAGVFLRRSTTSAANIIARIMPASTSCAGAAVPADCATNTQAAPPFIAAMQRHGLYSPGQIAGVLALTAYESAELRFRHNVVPGRPGQGTSNMQMPAYNALYAAAFPALADGLAAAAGDPAAVLALVTPDAYNFGSGAWFLATQCSAAVREQLAAGTDAGFAAYMGCVGVDATDSSRLAYWHAAQAAFGLSG